jgi:branched-chain amino acid transport system permease protein
MTPSASVPRLAAAAAFALILLVAVPLAITASHRTDLYYTLSSVALLSIASAGVWLTFYIGRINIGQGAYALVGGYVSAILVTTYGLSFWLSLPLAGLFCALVSAVIGLPILRLRGVYFAMVTLVLTEVARLSALALSITNGAKGITSIPAPGPMSLFGLTLVPPVRFVRREKSRLLHSLRCNDDCLLRRALPARQFADRAAFRGDAAERGARFLDGGQCSGAAHAGLCNFLVLRRRRRGDLCRDSPIVNFMLNCFLGDLSYVFGPMLGTLVLYFGWDLLFQTGEYQLLIDSGVMILLMLLLPNGLLSLRFRARGGS